MMDPAQHEFLVRLGPLAYPLLFCSVATLALLLERLLAFAFLPRLPAGVVERLEQAALSGQRHVMEEETARLHRALQPGFALLFSLCNQDRGLREDALRLWLRSFTRPLRRSLGLLMLLVTVSPLLGLLGTILGMVDAFQSLAAHDGPVHPSLLAGGIQEAMFTTAAGLVIAIPALLGAHLFRLAGQRYRQALEDAFDRLNFALDGFRFRTPVLPGKDQVAMQEAGALS